jgi:hexosaminidase
MRNRLDNISKRILPLFVVFTMLFSFVPVRAEVNTEIQRENLALGKSATASGYEAGSGFTADKVIDGTVDRPTDIDKGGSSRWASAINAVKPWITIDLTEVKAFDEIVIEWERRNVNSYKIEVSDDNSTWTAIHNSTTKNEFKEVLDVGSQNARYVRITIDDYSPTQEGGTVNWNTVSIYEVEIYNNEPVEPVEPEEPEVIVPAAGDNVALSKTATSSTNETSTLTADKAVDGIKTKASRWASAVSSAEQWITVDLGAKTQIENLVIEWERRNATEYKVQVSDDNSNWTDIYTATSSPAQTRQEINLSEAVATRYVRVFIAKHVATIDGTTWNNVSIYEIEIYNGGIPKGLDEITNSIKVKDLTLDDEVLPTPSVPEGYEISFVGADYEEVIGADMKIYRPLVDKTVRVNFKITKGNETAYTPDIEVLVPGSNEVSGNDAPTVIPELREWLGGSGNFEINDGSRIVIAPSSESELSEYMDVFSEDYKDIVGKEIEVVVSDSPKKGDFYFELNDERPELRTEGYYMEIGDFVKVESNEATAAFLSTRTILQILKQNGTTIPQGITRDYPLSDIRGFMLDVGRKPISLDFLYDITKLMSWYKMNDFQIHLNDNYIWVTEYGENAIEQAYAGFRLESNDVGENGVSLTSTDLSYTKEEFGEFIDESKLYGVNIVPEIESPAHALSFTKAHPEYAYGEGDEKGVGENAAMLDVTNPEVVDYIKGIFSEYTDGENPVFRDTTVHIGADEFYGTSEEYRAYTDEMLKYIRDEKGRTVRVWGSLSQKSGTTPVTSEGVEVNIWNNGWADPSDMFDSGYDLINTEDGKLYIVPDAGYYYDYLNTSYIYNSYEVNKFGNGDVIPAGSSQMRGGMFAVWNDMVDRKANGIVELDIYDRVLPAVQAVSEKMWGLAEDKTYAEFTEVAAEVSNAPNTNPRYTVESETEKVLEYDFKDASNSIVPDNSGNGYDSVALNNATIKNGVLKLNDSNSYLESAIENIGPNYTVSFSVKRDENSSNEEQILFESEKGSFKAVQKETGKVGFSREFYDYSFDYELPKGEWVDITIIGKMTKTELYVNGEYVDEVSKSSASGDNGTFVFPLAKVGSETNSFNGELKSLEVYNVAVNIADETIIPQETMKASATSEHPNVGTEGLASFAIDGNTATIWHTNYNNSVQLPQSITLDLGKAYTINKFSYLPRSNGGNGTITSYELQVSTNGTDFTTVSEGSWAQDATLKVVNFDEVSEVTHVRLIAKAGVGGFASAAELNVHKVKEVVPEPTPEVDKTALKITIDYADEVVAEGLLEGVVPAVVQEFNAALEEAKVVYESADATEEEVDAAFKRLVNSIWMLDFKQGNKEALQALVDSAKELVAKGYTSDSWDNLQEVIAASDAVLADENAMQEEVDETLDTLKAAIDGLVKVQVKKDALQNLANKLEELDKKEYIESTWTLFENALNEAKDTLANEDATQEEVDSAYNKLIKAYLDLRLLPDKSKLEDLINKAKEIDLSKYTDESANEVKIKLTRANEVVDNKDATQEEINEAARLLDTALDNLIAKDDTNGGTENDGDQNGGSTNTPEITNDSDKTENQGSNNGTNNGGKLPATGVETGAFGVVAVASIILGLGLMYRKRHKKIS